MTPKDKKIHQDIDTAFAVASWAMIIIVALIWLEGAI
jgi:hypothetical protein